ncbi:MAG: tetraacyldisaccharide 4'-kinase [Deltaproteobacteria bacterium]|nr:tetraacyldisaccharide 4'-kinase [Deltaproteobacteria bacterium]
MMKDPGKKRWGDYLFKERGRWGIVELLLFPFLIISWIYGLVVWIRTKFYQKGLQLPCKVISVGNITLGGTGKTPMVAYLAGELRKRGVKAGILSRGYKGLKERKGGVLSDGEKIYLTPAEAGDEPFMLAKMLSGVPLLVGKNRYAMGLYAHEKFGIDVLILDDGFQHLGIKRDLDIVLIDARSGFGNGCLFPRGPLREPLRGLRRASLFVLSKAEPSQPLGEIEGILRDLAPAVPLYHSRYKPIYLLEAASGKIFPPQFVHGKRILAFAGIADPEYFIYLLQGLGAAVVKEVRFPDHHNYAPKDLRMMREYIDKVEVFVTTEKDFVKLQKIPLDDLPLLILGIAQEILEAEAFYQTVLSALFLNSIIDI